MEHNPAAQAIPAPPPSGAAGLADAGNVRLLWMVAGLAMCGIILALMMAVTGLNIDLGSTSAKLLLLPISVFALTRYHLRGALLGPARMIRDFSEYTGLFITICLMCATASYPVSAASQHFSDASLAYIDGLFNFHWLDWYNLVAAHPWLQISGRIAYANIYFSPLLILASFAWSDARPQAEAFLLAFWIGAVLTLVLFVSMPAVGPLSYMWKGPIPYMPTSGTFQADLIPQLRNRTFGSIDLGGLQGLVCAPSFHTTSALLYIAAGWNNRLLRWPLLFLNLAMLLATPVEGTHYLADMIAGALVALAAMALARLALRQSPGPYPLRRFLRSGNRQAGRKRA